MKGELVLARAASAQTAKELKLHRVETEVSETLMP
jgi:hypothetical protein